jgi:hypothetical protein
MPARSVRWARLPSESQQIRSRESTVHGGRKKGIARDELSPDFPVAAISVRANHFLGG